MKAGEFAKEYILSIHKTINENGCWIPDLVPTNTGYVLITIRQRQYYLHRVVLCLWYDIDYDDNKIETRHGYNCSKACFNPEHLQPGTAKQNVADSVKYKEHANAAKICCPKCRGPYSTIRRGPSKGKRFCKPCQILARKILRHKKKFKL